MVAALAFLLRSKEGKRFRALSVYLVLRVVSYAILAALWHGAGFLHLSREAHYRIYFFAYWPFFLASAIAVFFVILELFKLALEPLPGLKRLGLVAFRWVACVSCLAGLAVVIVPGVKANQFPVGAACEQLVRCESIFLLSLLFFLMTAAGKLGLSYRSRIFGISFGFGIMAASNLIASAIWLNFDSHHLNIGSSAISMMDTGAGVLALMVWSAFFIRREPVRQAVALPTTSPLARWNDIAMALSPAGTRLAVTAPTSDFFIQDVEKVVDRILAKNSLNVAS